MDSHFMIGSYSWQPKIVHQFHLCKINSFDRIIQLLCSNKDWSNQRREKQCSFHYLEFEILYRIINPLITSCTTAAGTFSTRYACCFPLLLHSLLPSLCTIIVPVLVE